MPTYDLLGTTYLLVTIVLAIVALIGPAKRAPGMSLLAGFLRTFVIVLYPTVGAVFWFLFFGLRYQQNQAER